MWLELAWGRQSAVSEQVVDKGREGGACFAQVALGEDAAVGAWGEIKLEARLALKRTIGNKACGRVNHA